LVGDQAGADLDVGYGRRLLSPILLTRVTATNPVIWSRRGAGGGAGDSHQSLVIVDHLHQFNRKTNPLATRHEVEKKYYSRPDKKENILASVGTQTNWLRQIGFEDVDCFFKVFELALFGGRRTSDMLE
jgi:hypothetical protein